MTDHETEEMHTTTGKSTHCFLDKEGRVISLHTAAR